MEDEVYLTLNDKEEYWQGIYLDDALTRYLIFWYLKYGVS